MLAPSAAASTAAAHRGGKWLSQEQEQEQGQRQREPQRPTRGVLQPAARRFPKEAPEEGEGEEAGAGAGAGGGDDDDVRRAAASTMVEVLRLMSAMPAHRVPGDVALPPAASAYGLEAFLGEGAGGEEARGAANDADKISLAEALRQAGQRALAALRRDERLRLGGALVGGAGGSGATDAPPRMSLGPPLGAFGLPAELEEELSRELDQGRRRIARRIRDTSRKIGRSIVEKVTDTDSCPSPPSPFLKAGNHPPWD
mmetsp:Transcript_23649/g.76023  ORF Transcript_23649/g.76023 Transcript_23649/m.76023 type:complete len:256 (-) Transcript_23649:123-890(-)